jgi:hypothetical protein
MGALLRPRREGVQAEVAEFPDIKVSSWSIGAALARLREALWQKRCVGPKWKLAALANRFRLSTEGIDPRLGRAD